MKTTLTSRLLNSIGTATTTEKKFKRDRSSWIKQFNSAKNYTSYIHNIFESDSTSNYSLHKDYQVMDLQ